MPALEKVPRQHVQIGCAYILNLQKRAPDWKISNNHNYYHYDEECEKMGALQT